MSGCERLPDYDVLVDWERRLAREGPFFRTLFERHAVRSVADVGAGSARHAIMFRSWGLDVWAIDPAEGMLERARANAERLGADIHIARGAFGEVSGLLPSSVDAVTCTGNALPHVDGVEGLREALSDFRRSLRPGGVLVLHLLNHHRILAKLARTVPPVFRETAEGDAYFLRLMDPDERGERILFDFVTLVRDARVRGQLDPQTWPNSLAADPQGGWQIACRRSVHTALPHGVLARELAAAGFGGIELYGAHDFSEFRPDEDESVIAVAIRR